MRKNISPKESSKRSRDICSISKVIPVLTLNRVEDAKPLADALVSGGLRVLEVTLRTPNALKIIIEASKINGAIVGAGTLLTRLDVKNASNAGAKFGVSPGVTEEILVECEKVGLPLIGTSMVLKPT